MRHRSHALLLLLALAALPLAPRAGGREAGRAETPPDDSWFLIQRAGPDGTLPAAAMRAAVLRAQLDRAAANSALGTSSASENWTCEGPFDVGGRVTALAATSGGLAYLGSADGGVFKSTNGGASWTPVTDPLTSTSIGALAISPFDPNTVWVGTGEANSSLDSYDGDGLWVSHDGGASWHRSGLEATARIAAVVVDPTDPTRLYVAAMGTQFSTGPDRGFYRSLDGGQTWTRTLFVDDSTGVCDIAVNPAHPDTMFCATWERVRRLSYRRAYGPDCGVWRSVDRGATWTRLAGGLPAPSDNVGRIGLALAPSRPSTIYAQVTSGAIGGYVGLGLYRSDDGGDTWARRDLGSSNTFTGAFGGFSWYFGEIAVNPANPEQVWCGGVSLIRSDDGGQTFTDVTGAAHVDQHALWVDPSLAGHLELGNDGGFWSTSDGVSWAHATLLPISQFYAGDVAATDAGKIVGGLQDNGNVQTTTGPLGWSPIFVPADGFYDVVDWSNENVQFSEYQFCSSGQGIYRSVNGGGSFARASGFSTSDRYNWCTPIVMSPRNHNELLVGSQRVYKSTNNGVSFAAVSGDLTTNPVASVTYGTITTLAISAADTMLYLAGTDDGKVWRSQNSGASWQDITAGLPGRYVTRVVADPADPQVVYVTLSGFGQDEHAPHVFRSADRGTHWTDISAALLDAPVNDLVVDPADTQTLYAGTDMGVYATHDLGQTWYPLGAGMPIQQVQDLQLHAATRRLFAFTHGRSAWSLDLSALPAAVGPSPASGGALALTAPSPNPSRGATRFALVLGADAQVDAGVFDASGRRVRTLFRGALAAGRHDVSWDGSDARGQRAGQGVYFVRASANGVVRAQRVVLAR